MDHDLDFPIDRFEMCDRAGICAFCDADYLDCRCDEDRQFVIEVAAHPMGCICCVEDLVALDVVYNASPARVQSPRAPKPWREEDSLISSGADF